MKKIREIVWNIDLMTDTLEKKVVWLLSVLVSAGALICTLVTLAEGLTGIALGMVGVCIIVPVIAVYLGWKTGKYSEIYAGLCILINCILLPFIFFTNGGFHSGMLLVMAGAMLLTALIMDLKTRLILFAAAIAVQGTVFVLAVKYPELVTPIREDLVRLDQVSCFLFVEAAQLVAVTLVLTEYSKALKKEKKLSDQKAVLRFDMMEAQHENVEAFRRMRHDARHHNALILEMLRNQQYDELIRYMEQKQESDEEYATVIYCMNPVVNSILSVYTRKARKSGIEVQVKADVPPNISVSAPDLVAMFSNIYENAIHGAQQSEKPDKKITAEISVRSGHMAAFFRNTCADDLQLYNGFPTQTPGTGIRSVLESAKRCNGTLLYQIKDGWLQCSLILSV